MDSEQTRAILEKINAIPMSRFLIAGLLAAAFYYFTLYDDSSNLDAQIQTVQQELDKETQRLNEAEALIAGGKKFEADVKFISDQFEKALEYLPTDLNMSDLTKKITSEAKASGSQIVTIKPKTERNQFEFYEELLIDLQLRGTFAEITMFLSFISKIPRIIKIKKIAMVRSEQQDNPANVEVLFSGQLAAYRYIEKAKKEDTNTGTSGESGAEMSGVSVDAASGVMSETQ